MLKIIILVVLTAIGAACSQSPTSPTVATPKAVAHELDYDINIPDIAIVQQLQVKYPKGVKECPINAQLDWNYTAAYGGSSNVYYGPLAGAPGQYIGTGIVIAPIAVASEETFFAAEWPLLAAVSGPSDTYFWVGHFVYTRNFQ